MAFFIAGCSSTPDVSGTYLSVGSNNQPTGAIVLKVDSLNNKEYIYNKLSDSEIKQYQHLFE